MTTHVLAWLLTYLFNALWQIPLLFVAAWIVARMLRRLGPQVEHRIWVGTLLFQIVLPACNLHIASLWRALLDLLPSQRGSDSGGVRVLFGPATTAGSTLHLSYALEAAILCAWAFVVLYFALRLGWGFVQTRNLAHSATSIEAPGAAGSWMSHCARFGIATAPQIAMSVYATAPVAIGLRRGMILLPPNLIDTIAQGDFDAVLAHELAHIARRDFAKNLLYSLVSLPIAWHPLLWRTRMRVAESRELICDEAAAAAVAGPRQYAESLLRLASAFAGQPRLAVHAVGILDFSTSGALERRVMTLTRKRTPLSTGRRILLAGVCSILAASTCASALALHTDIAALSSAPSKAPKKVSVSAAVMTGNKISGENPTYPAEARKKKVQGAVVLDALISKEGEIKDLRVTKSPDKLLTDSAMKAVRTWRYRPYLLNGEPVEVETTINVIYNLGG